MQKIIELVIAAILGGLITMAISWLMVYGKIRVLTASQKKLEVLDERFTTCHEEHINCPEKIKEDCHDAISNLAEIVDALAKTVTIISSTLDAHLKLTSQLDTITEQRFVRIERQLGRIESKLDELKGWKLVKDTKRPEDL
jgi:predicted transcriptional regulator